MLSSSLARPKQLLTLFTEYAELASTEIDAYLAEIKSSKNSLDDYAKQMEKWTNMSQRVMEATPPEVHCRLLLVACGELKAALATKADAIARGVAGLIVDELQLRADGPFVLRSDGTSGTATERRCVVQQQDAKACQDCQHWPSRGAACQRRRRR